MDYADLTGEQAVREALPDLTTELKEQPELILNCLGVAIHQVPCDPEVGGSILAGQAGS